MVQLIGFQQAQSTYLFINVSTQDFDLIPKIFVEGGGNTSHKLVQTLEQITFADRQC